MEREKKIFFVVTGGILALAGVVMYIDYSNNNKERDQFRVPKNETAKYDNKLEEYRKNKSNQQFTPKFTEADSIEVDGHIIEHPEKATKREQDEMYNRSLKESQIRQREVLDKLQSRVSEIDENKEEIKYYKPKGEKITYRGGKAYVNGKELKDEEPVPQAIQNALAALDQVDVKAEGTPKSFSADNINYSNGVVPCVVHNTQVVKNGGTILVRVTQDASIGDTRIKKHSILSAIIRFNNDRVNITIKSLRTNNKFYVVNMVGLGEDGNEGLPLSSAVEMQAVSNEVGNAIVNETSQLLQNFGVAGRALGSVARGVNSATRNQKNREIKIIGNQKINFFNYDN